MENPKIIEVNEINIEQEHICCAIGSDKINRKRADEKKEWLKKRFSDGHRFLKLDVRGKIFIEFEPGEKAWMPIEADGYNVIQCFWVSGRYKGQGYGKALLKRCEELSEGTSGLVAITGDKKRPFMVDRKFLIMQGFQIVDSAPPYFQLAVKKFIKDVPDPKFNPGARVGKIPGKKGFSFYYSPACPFNRDFTYEMAELAGKRGYKTEIIKIDSREMAQSLPIGFSIFSFYLDGVFQDHQIYPGKSFIKYLDNLPG